MTATRLNPDKPTIPYEGVLKSWTEDGKTVYEQTYKLSAPNAGTETLYVGDFTAMCDVCWIERASNHYFYSSLEGTGPVPYYYDSSDYSHVWMFNGTLSVNFAGANAGRYVMVTMRGYKS